ncbi:MAG: CHAT domain-containing protein [Candidatus Lokiarchaeota archaeon]|nr:CHAT domain-containing protein [Candidatus Lokiarchaeota archaeon]
MAENNTEDINMIKLELRIILKRIKILMKRIKRKIIKLKRLVVKLYTSNKEEEAKFVFYSFLDSMEYLNQLEETFDKYSVMMNTLEGEVSEEEIKNIKNMLHIEEQKREKEEVAEEVTEGRGGGGLHFKWFRRKLAKEKVSPEIKKSIEEVLKKEIPKQEVEVPASSEQIPEFEESWNRFTENMREAEDLFEESKPISSVGDLEEVLETIEKEPEPELPPPPSMPVAGRPKPPEETSGTKKEEAPKKKTETIEESRIVSEEKSKSIKRFADINAEKKMELEKENSLTVQLKRDATTVAGTIVMLNIPVKIEEKVPEIDIFVVSPGMEIPENRKTMKVPLDSDSDIIEFTLIPKELGKHYIFIEFYQESKMLGRAILEVDVKKKIKKTERINKEFKFNMVRDTDIDATLRIIRYGNEFIFSLFTKHGGTILDPKSTFGTSKVKNKYIKNLNDLIREVAFDFDEPKTSLTKIIKLGEKVYKLIPKSIRDAIRKINPKYLIFETGDLFVPFELAYDGEDFLCLKYCIGKRILDESKDFSCPPVCFGTPDFDFILIESNPKHDLELKERELISELIKDYRINFTTLIGKNANRKILNKLLVQPLEIVHFAGHGMFNKKDPDKSGLLMEDGILTAEDIKNIKINGYPLIFINACEAGTIKKVDKLKGVGGIARAFLGSGAIGFVGPLWEITDDLAAEFANEFYTKMIKNNLTVGEAIRKVKNELKAKYPHILWATFNYYGDPTLHLCPQINI